MANKNLIPIYLGSSLGPIWRINGEKECPSYRDNLTPATYNGSTHSFIYTGDTEITTPTQYSLAFSYNFFISESG